jgi:3'-5' exoribonuclease
VQGAIDLDRRIAMIQQQSASEFPEALRLRLLHMIISHHGQLEHGSPKVPMTIEAIVLAYLDDLDAKINQATELIAADRNTDSDWTTFHPSLSRKLYKPSLSS